MAAVGNNRQFRVVTERSGQYIAVPQLRDESSEPGGTYARHPRTSASAQHRAARRTSGYHSPSRPSACRRTPCLFRESRPVVRFDPDDVAAWLESRRVSGSGTIEGPRPRWRCDPGASDNIGFLGGEPRQGIALGAEGRGRDMPAPVIPAGRLPATGRQLAGTPEMRTGHARVTTARSRTQRARHCWASISLSAACPLNCPFVVWWRRWDSNPRPPACKAGALATELRPLAGCADLGS
jgi:hypothetical protein